MAGTTMFTIPTAFTAVDKFSGPVRQMQKATSAFVANSSVALARAERAWRSFTGPLAGIKNAMNNLGFYVGLYTFIRVFRDAYNTLADFEMAQVRLSAVNHKSIKENKAFTDQARDFSVKYGIAAEKVAMLQYELEKLGGLDVLKVTEPVLIGAAGLELDAPDYGELVGKILKAFHMQSSEASKVVDQMVTIADITAVAGKDFDVFLRSSIGAASIAGGEFSELLAMMGMMKDEAVQMASGGTAAKNLFIDSSVLMGGKKTWQEILAIAFKSERVLKKVRDFFGRKTLVGAIPLGKDPEEFKRLKQLLDSEEILGAAQRRQLTMLDSMRGKASLAGTAYDELILAVNDGDGALGKAVKHWLDVTRAVLLLAAGSSIAENNFKTLSPEVQETAKSFLFWLRILKWIVIVLGSIWLALKIASAGLVIWNTLSWAGIWLGRGMVFMFTRLIPSIIAATAAQGGLNAAMLANPIGLIIAAVAILIILMYQMVKHWDDWGAAASTLLGPLGGILSFFVELYRNWDKVTTIFKNGGLWEAIKALGLVLLQSFLYPFQKVYELIHKITGWDWAGDLAKYIEAIRKASGSVLDEKAKEKVNPEADERKRQQDDMNQFMGTLKVELNDPGKQVKGVKTQGISIMPVVTSTHGFAGSGQNGYNWMD